MPILLLGLAAAAAVLLLKSGAAGHAQTTTVAVMAGDNATVMPGWFAVWHSTLDQTNLFGPKSPSYWNLNGYFMFDNGSGGFDAYKPDWQVPTQGPQA
jgi:hypothetical protein